ncbi:hypothetical protein BDV12DRAFT_60828 [Aspergillus spectabilis]
MAWTLEVLGSQSAISGSDSTYVAEINGVTAKWALDGLKHLQEKSTVHSMVHYWYFAQLHKWLRVMGFSLSRINKDGAN